MRNAILLPLVLVAWPIAIVVAGVINALDCIFETVFCNFDYDAYEIKQAILLPCLFLKKVWKDED